MIKVLLWLFSVIVIPIYFTKRKGDFSFFGATLGSILGILVIKFL